MICAESTYVFRIQRCFRCNHLAKHERTEDCKTKCDDEFTCIGIERFLKRKQFNARVISLILKGNST